MFYERVSVVPRLSRVPRSTRRSRLPETVDREMQKVADAVTPNPQLGVTRAVAGLDRHFGAAGLEPPRYLDLDLFRKGHPASSKVGPLQQRFPKHPHARLGIVEG